MSPVFFWYGSGSEILRLLKIVLVYREPLRLQMKVFMDEVQQQLMLPTIRSVTGIETVKKGSVVRTYGDLPTS
jgi:hypothetical protein